MPSPRVKAASVEVEAVVDLAAVAAAEEVVAVLAAEEALAAVVVASEVEGEALVEVDVAVVALEVKEIKFVCLGGDRSVFWVLLVELNFMMLAVKLSCLCSHFRWKRWRWIRRQTPGKENQV